MHTAHGGIGFGNVAVQIVDDHAVAGSLKDTAILGFGFAQLFLGLFARSDIGVEPARR